MENQNKSNNTIALVLGIVGLVLGTLGAILFGVFCAIPGLICGIVGMVMAIDIKKKTNNQQGMAAFVVGLLALIFSALFSIGCTACAGSCTDGYGCKGIVGGSCAAANDANSATENALEDLNDLFGN